jgi:CO/xanthine dehydrogenase Mo-binding subunit
MIDVSTLVGDIPTTPVTVRTYGATSVNAFGETTASYTDEARDVVVHPAPAEMLERRPDSDRHRESIAVYSKEPLRTVGQTKPNKVFFKSRWYEIVDSEDYESLGGIFITLAQLVEDS